MKKSILLSLVFGLLLMPGQAAAGTLFTDVYDSDPVSSALSYLMDAGVVEGYDDGSFKSLNLINRAEFTKMVVEGVMGVTPDSDSNNNCFSDVATAWYAKYVCYAKDEGLVEGYSGNLFKPGDNIMRAEAVKIISEAYKWDNLSDVLAISHFSDNQDESAWYFGYLMKAEERGLFDTLDYYISPNELISRKQMSELLYRAMNYEDGTPVSARTLGTDRLSYQDVLATGIEAAYPVTIAFPTSSQKGWAYGCYSFAIKNLLKFKYNFDLNVGELKNTIDWDESFIWDPTEDANFARVYDYDLLFTYNASAEYFFKKLAMGEPLTMYIPYYSGGVNIGHQVTAYSFDQNGVWISDSLSGGVLREIGYDLVFVDGATYTINITEMRKVKDGGEYRTQGF